MKEELILLCLLLLIVTHAFLVKGCFKLHMIIPESSSNVASEASRITEVLDDVADMIHSALESIPQSPSSSPVASIPEMLLTGLISKMNMGEEHGSTQKPFNGSLHEVHPTPTLETED